MFTLTGLMVPNRQTIGGWNWKLKLRIFDILWSTDEQPDTPESNLNRSSLTNGMSKNARKSLIVSDLERPKGRASALAAIKNGPLWQRSLSTRLLKGYYWPY